RGRVVLLDRMAGARYLDQLAVAQRLDHPLGEGPRQDRALFAADHQRRAGDRPQRGPVVAGYGARAAAQPGVPLPLVAAIRTLAHRVTRHGLAVLLRRIGVLAAQEVGDLLRAVEHAGIL